MSGYNIEWKNGNSKSAINEIDKEINTVTDHLIINNESIVASTDNFYVPKKYKDLRLNTPIQVHKKETVKKVNTIIKKVIKKISIQSKMVDNEPIPWEPLAGFGCSVAGIISLLLFIELGIWQISIFTLLIFGILGIVFSRLGENKKLKGFAIAGLMLGIMDLLIFIFVLSAALLSLLFYY